MSSSKKVVKRVSDGGGGGSGSGKVVKKKVVKKKIVKKVVKKVVRRKKDPSGDGGDPIDDEAEQRRRRRLEEEHRRQQAELEAQLRQQEELRRKEEAEAEAARQRAAAADQDDEDGGDDYADEDFDDYDDDFDDFDEDAAAELDDAAESGGGQNDSVLAAMARENEQARMAPPAAAPRAARSGPFAAASGGGQYDGGYDDAGTEDGDEGEYDEGEPVSDQYRDNRFARMNAVKTLSPAEQLARAQASKRVAQRYQDLKDLVQFDAVGFDLFDQPPVSEYSLYMRSFGSSTSVQAAAQTNEDALDRDCQTEEIERVDKDMQFPDDLGFGYGASDGAGELGRFLLRAGPVCESIMEENLLDNTTVTGEKAQAGGISASYHPLICPALFGTRRIVDIAFSTTYAHVVLVAYGAPQGGGESSATTAGLLCLWNLNEPSTPTKILVCEGQVTSCGLSPLHASIAFAGTAEGTVQVWDMRELSAFHQTEIVNRQVSVLRRPTYSTDGLYGDNHEAPICRVMAVVARSSGETRSVADGDSQTFQLAALDTAASVSIWSVVELGRKDSATASEFDLGLSIGGSVRLVRTTTIAMSNVARAFDFQFHPDDVNRFVAGTDTGNVVHYTRFGEPATPKTFHATTPAAVGDVGSVHFSPFFPTHFLAAHSDGTVRLFSTKSGAAQLVAFTGFASAAITCVRWSSCRPAVFFAADKRSNIYVFDLLQNGSLPIVAECLEGKGQPGKGSSVVAIAHSPVTGRAAPVLAVGYANGNTEIHKLTKAWSVARPREEELTKEHLDFLY